MALVDLEPTVCKQAFQSRRLMVVSGISVSSSMNWTWDAVCVSLAIGVCLEALCED